MKIRSVLIGLACLLSAASAQANVHFDVTTSVTGGHALNAVQLNDLITINIRLSNDATLAPPTLDFVAGVGGAIMSYNPAIVEFQSGVSADTSLFCTNVACTNGLVSNFDSTTPLVEATAQAPSVVGRYVQFVNAVSTTARNGNGAKDPGIDTIVNGGDKEFQAIFKVIGTSGTTTFDIGTTTDLGLGNVIVIATASNGAGAQSVQGVNATVTITVPEPGAVFAGLSALMGSVGMAVIRRRIAA